MTIFNIQTIMNKPYAILGGVLWETVEWWVKQLLKHNDF